MLQAVLSAVKDFVTERLTLSVFILAVVASAYPSKSAINVKAPEIPSIKGMSGDDAVRSVLASALKLLPEGKNVSWVVRHLLKLQKFIFKPLLAGFFAGGVFLESLMMLVLHWIHLGHVYVIWLYRQLMPVKA
jgi:hypothetical protein